MTARIDPWPPGPKFEILSVATQNFTLCVFLPTEPKHAVLTEKSVRNTCQIDRQIPQFCSFNLILYFNPQRPQSWLNNKCPLAKALEEFTECFWNHNLISSQRCEKGFAVPISEIRKLRPEVKWLVQGYTASRILLELALELRDLVLKLCGFPLLASD